MDSSHLRALFIFILSYILLYLLSQFLSQPLGILKWDLKMAPGSFLPDFSVLDYSLLLVPVVGFAFIYFLIPYLRSEFGFGKNFIYAFPIIFSIASYLAFIVAVYWYVDNNAKLSGTTFDVLAQQTGLDFLKLFFASHFFYFVLAGVLGWFARILIEHFSEAK